MAWWGWVGSRWDGDMDAQWFLEFRQFLCTFESFWYDSPSALNRSMHNVLLIVKVRFWLRCDVLVFSTCVEVSLWMDEPHQTVWLRNPLTSTSLCCSATNGVSRIVIQEVLGIGRAQEQSDRCGASNCLCGNDAYRAPLPRLGCRIKCAQYLNMKHSKSERVTHTWVRITSGSF